MSGETQRCAYRFPSDSLAQHFVHLNSVSSDSISIDTHNTAQPTAVLNCTMFIMLTMQAKSFGLRSVCFACACISETNGNDHNTVRRHSPAHETATTDSIVDRMRHRVAVLGQRTLCLSWLPCTVHSPQLTNVCTLQLASCRLRFAVDPVHCLHFYCRRLLCEMSFRRSWSPSSCTLTCRLHLLWTMRDHLRSDRQYTSCSLPVVQNAVLVTRGTQLTRSVTLHVPRSFLYCHPARQFSISRWANTYIDSATSATPRLPHPASRVQMASTSSSASTDLRMTGICSGFAGAVG